MRNISFFLTQDQIKRREKTITRRLGWEHATKGLVLRGVVKGQGIPKGEKIQPLAIIEIISCRAEPLDSMIKDLEYGKAEVISEGFPEMSPGAFVEMFCAHNGIEPHTLVRRIEFKYRDDLWGLHEMSKIVISPHQETITPNLKKYLNPQPKEPIMARPKKSTENNKPAMDEGQVLSEKDQVDKAFSSLSAKAKKSKPEDDEEIPLELAPITEAVAPMRTVSATPMYIQNLDADNESPSFQLCVFQEYTEAEFAQKGKELAALDVEGALLDKEMKDVMKEWKEKISAVEARRMAMSANINSKGEEKDIECRKRINEDTGVATIYNVHTLQIVEERKLDASELQTELLFKNANASGNPPKGAKVVKGNFPKNQIFGATTIENPELDAANEAALKALAGND